MILLGTFEEAQKDLIFEAENENGTLFDAYLSVAEIAEFLAIDGKKINLIDGSDDIMEAGRQMFERWACGSASYSIEVVRQKKLIFKTSKAK